MINVEAIDRAITVMKRVQKMEESKGMTLLDMAQWQSGVFSRSRSHTTEEAVVSDCGTTCCFAGWLAVAPEFPNIRAGNMGKPIFKNAKLKSYSVGKELAKLFGVSELVTNQLIYGSNDHTTPADIINVLEGWKNAR